MTKPKNETRSDERNAAHDQAQQAEPVEADGGRGPRLVEPDDGRGSDAERRANDTTQA